MSKSRSLFYLNIRTENDAFQPEGAREVARLLRDVAKRLEAGEQTGKIRDFNGNTVGEFNIGA